LREAHLQAQAKERRIELINMNESEEKKEQGNSRREFIQLGAAAILGSSLLNSCAEQTRSALPVPTEAQRANKKQGRSRVFLAEVKSYDHEPLLAALKDGWKQLGPDAKNKNVFLKINLVDYRKDLPVCTDPAVVAAAIDLLRDAGARDVKVGDGPALARNTEDIARLTGIEAVCKKAGVEFVDLNIDDLETVKNPVQFTEIEEFVFPRSVLHTDLLISVPKLKMHHWALMTCSMKNMFGVVPGRKYGWPKNILHIRGINSSIVDVVASVKPHFAIVDGVVGMEGDGPLSGTAKELHAIAMGDDLAAVDTVCGMCVGLPVENIPYLKLAGMVLGNSNIGQIDLIGASIESLKKKFALPPTFEEDGRPKNLSKLEKNAEQGVT
jgi:uncharacterized protein (DUF362 family)